MAKYDDKSQLLFPNYEKHVHNQTKARTSKYLKNTVYRSEFIPVSAIISNVLTHVGEELRETTIT